MRRMRRGTRRGLLGLGIALGGLGLAFAYAPAGVAVTFAAALLCMPMDFNVPGRRLMLYGAMLCNAGAIYVGSGSLLLAAVPLPLAFGVPTEFLAKRSPVLLVAAPWIGAIASLVLFGLAWPTGLWGFAVAPWLIGLLPLTRWFEYAKAVQTYDQLPKPLKIGQPIPPLRLPRVDGGEPFDFADRQGRFTLLCFVRGNWCPVCHVMMRVFSKEAETFARYNVDLVAISPEQGVAATSFARDMGLDYTFLVDEGAQVAKAWGILDLGEHNGNPVPMPVCMLVDPQGILRFLSRPEDIASIADKRRVLALVEAHAAKAA